MLGSWTVLSNRHFYSIDGIMAEINLHIPGYLAKVNKSRDKSVNLFTYRMFLLRIQRDSLADMIYREKFQAILETFVECPHFFNSCKIK